MKPVPFALDLYRGDTGRWRFVLWQDVDKTTPTDLTGATAKAEIRDKSGGAKIIPMLCEITLPNIIDVTLDAATSHGIALTKAVWDLQLTFDTGDVVTPLAGGVTITGDVTDSTVPTAVL